MNFEDGETELIGAWVVQDGHVNSDQTGRRISSLVREKLRKVGVAGGGWEILFQDPQDGRLWELTFPRGEMQGGGPRALRLVREEDARRKYDF
jgi:hypothetical protein